MAQDAEFTATFGPYQIRKLLGTGRIASVFAAVAGEGADAEQAVALKVFAGRVRRDVAMSPARAQTHGLPGVRVQHPALVQLYEVGRVGDNLFLSMERVDGPALDQLLTAARKGGHPLEPHAVMTIAVQIADGLRALHLAEAGGSLLGFVHADLRPSNVLLSRDGQAKIAGWGVANLLRAYAELEEPARSLEPPLYVSPEQSRGEDLTPATDVFSWGVLVLELITGKAIFDTPTLKGSLRKLRGVQIKAPMNVVREAFPDLAPILETALQKLPAARYHDGKELFEALQPLAPPATAREILVPLIGEVEGDIPDGFDPDDELLDRVSHLDHEGLGQSVSSFVLPPSDPVATVTPLALENGADAGEEESSGGHMASDDLTATDEIGVTEEIAGTSASTSLVEDTGEYSDDLQDDLQEEDTPADSTFDEEEDSHGGVATADEEASEGVDGPDSLDSPDATETLPGDGVPAEKALDPNLEISAFNPPSTDDDEMETTIPPLPGTQEAMVAKGAAQAAGRKTERVYQGAPAAAGRTAKRPSEKVTVWTGTGGRPETVTTGQPVEKPTVKWQWIAASIAVVVLLGVLLVFEFIPPRGERTGGEAADGVGVAGDGTANAGAATERQSIDRSGGTSHGGADATGDAGTTGGAGENPLAGTEAPPLDPSILGPDSRRPGDDEPLTPFPVEEAGDGDAAATVPVQEMVVQHSPVTRGIRGRAISLSVSVDPPGSYQALIWYRAAGGPWNQTGARGGGNGTLSGSIPHGSWLGDEADRVEYYIEVVGVNETRSAGSATSPYGVKIY